MFLASIHATGHIEWGDVAVWVGSIATSVALLLTYRLLRLTRAEQRALQLEQRRHQARRVSAWCESVEPSAAGLPDVVVVRLRNASDEPIYGARVAVGAEWLGEQVKYTELDLSYVIPPDYDRPHAVKLRVGRVADGGVDQSPPVEIIFGDAAGRFWLRDRYGGVEEIIGGAPRAAGDYFFKRTATSPLSP